MYEDVIVTLLGLAIAFFLLIVLVLLVYMWSRLNVLEKKIKVGTQVRDKTGETVGGDLMGYRGKQIWDVLQSSSVKEKNIGEIRNRYVFTLARHIEQVIDQGQLDFQKGRAAIPGSTATIGGVRGEVESWLPILQIDKLYRLGQRSEEDPDNLSNHRQELRSIVEGLAESLGLQSEASGISRLVASHTIDFRQSISDGNEVPANETSENGTD